jgi:hypothetical protein
MPDCRFCGEPEAYDSGFTVECCNYECDHYNEDQRIRRADKALEKLQREQFLKEYLSEESTDPDITPTFHWGIDSTLDEGLE